MNIKNIIGIDGGGTSTTAIICNLDGKILATKNDKATQLQIIGTDKSAQIIFNIIKVLCKTVKCKLNECAIVAGIAGAGRKEEQLALENKIYNLSNNELKDITITSDAEITLQGAFDGNDGIIVIAGTGSIIYAKINNKIFRVGGWGRIIGDAGSGYAIGQSVLKHIASEFDNATTHSILFTIIKRRYKFSSQEKIIDAIYKNNFAVQDLAKIALICANYNCDVSKSILRKECNNLIKQIKLTLKNVSKICANKKINICLCGSLLTQKSFYSDLVCQELAKVKNINICNPKYSPCLGAVQIKLNILKKRI